MHRPEQRGTAVDGGRLCGEVRGGAGEEGQEDPREGEKTPCLDRGTRKHLLCAGVGGTGRRRPGQRRPHEEVLHPPATGLDVSLSGCQLQVLLFLSSRLNR